MYLSLVLIVMIVAGTYILLSLQNIEIEKSRSQLESYAQKIEEQVVLNFEEEQFESGLTSFSRANSVQMEGSILDKDGKTISTTASSRGTYPEYKNAVIISAMAGQSAFDEGDTDTNEWMSYAAPVLVNEEVRYIVFVQMDGSPIRESLQETRRTIIVAVGLALFLTAIMGYFFSKTLADPILILSSKAKELASGDLNQRLTVRSDDEIGQLTESFNDMSQALSKNLSEISREKNKMEIILHNMTDGVISFDRSGQVILYNTASVSMLDLEEMHYSLSEFLSAYDINSGIYLDLKPEGSRQCVFPVGKKFIKASFSANVNAQGEMEGLIVVLQDITEERRLDDMRKEFVANVSHELRTPLTTVKSYTETLMDGAIDDKEVAMDFLSIIESEADRMAFLVRDLLQLSRFDNQQISLRYATFDLNDLVSENLRQNRIHAENKKQKLTFTPFPREALITADRDRVAQVFNNILTNAIKYSLEQASITIRITEDAMYYRLSVQDTGMGIRREDLPRIFERFYRVDKARSRAMGGTGLGLAIAKEIMELHGGQILAESEYGKGTTMTLCFLKTPFQPMEEPVTEK